MADPNFKVGEYVMVDTDPTAPYFGEVKEIAQRNTDGEIFYRIDGGKWEREKNLSMAKQVGGKKGSDPNAQS